MARDAPGAAVLAAAALAGGAAATALLRRLLIAPGVPDPGPVPLHDHFAEADLAPARRYRRGVRALALAGAPVGPAVGLAVHRASPAWRPALVRAAGGRAWASGLGYGAGSALVHRAAGLPLAFARYRWGRRHGLVVQPTGAWLADQAKAAALETAFAGAAGAAGAALIRALPRT
ncbi:MAG: hypothetical protein MUE51_03280, partial [Thermoleophilia bacterium]|nr:hypothetical protein [Thermoleophilia bacterium]